MDKIEDSTKISQQILREFNDELGKAITSEAQVKTIALQNRATLVKAKTAVTEWETKLNGILDRQEKDPNNAELENLAKIAAQHYTESVTAAATAEQNAKISDNQANVMEGKIKTLQHEIAKAKDKTVNIAAKQQIAEASEIINKSLSSNNTDGLMSTLDRMEAKADNTQFRADAYADSGTISDEAKINAVLESSSAEDTLAAFKAKRNK